MTEAEARALVAALDQQFSFPSDDSWVLQRRSAVESYFEKQSPDGSWSVVLLWTQGSNRFGTVVEQLTDLVADQASTAAQVAVDYRMFCVEEPHALDGVRDPTGRIWLSG